MPVSKYCLPSTIAIASDAHAMMTSAIAAFDARVQAAGLNSLSYFDVGNWGVSIDTGRAWPNLTCGSRPSGAPAPCPTPEGSNLSRCCGRST